MFDRLRYWRRIASAYVLSQDSALSFWHERPAANPGAEFNRLGGYYMTFADKADYAGPFDAHGVPLLDYRGRIGRQYNPIAVAQYGLAHDNRFRASRDDRSRRALLAQADWLVDNLRENAHGVPVWNHEFDFEYRQTLRAPWYSGLAQGQGLSLLVRAHAATGDRRYSDAAARAFVSFQRDVSAGGVLLRDGRDLWIEEYLVQPPTHILNGFIWALWGLRDYYLAAGDAEARGLFSECVETIARNLHRYDAGYWSLYELSETRIPMLASPFYHKLHQVQLRILSQMTGLPRFSETARQWEDYERDRINRARSLIGKSAFKLLYY